MPILSQLIWWPIVASILVLLAGSSNPVRARWLSLAASIVQSVLAVKLWRQFDGGRSELQLTELHAWLPAFEINYALAVDGISVVLILLTVLFTLLVVISAWQVIKERTAEYHAAFLLLEGLMIGVFCATDAVLFYAFFEAMLIPMFLIIGIWGGPRRVYATIKFFLYTFLGSVFMLIALIYLYIQTGTFDLQRWYVHPIDLPVQIWLFMAFLVAFAVKVPMWPVHTWLPDAHVEAPTGGSVILAAIMLKIGGYGFLRFNLPITPDASRELDWLMIGLSLIAIVYIGLVALAQSDMKKLIAYSSVAHMGFVTLGYFVPYAMADGTQDMQRLALQGGTIQMISHGFISGALFLCVGVLYERLHSRNISDYGGVVNVMPRFAVLFVLFAMANAGLPGTSGFVGEFMVIIASIKANVWYGVLAATTLVIGAGYTLWMVKRVMFGPIRNDSVAALQDINARETMVLMLLALLVLWLGIWPAPIIDLLSPAVDQLVTFVAATKLPS